MDESNTVELELKCADTQSKAQCHLLETRYSFQVGEVESREDSPLDLGLESTSKDSLEKLRVRVANRLTERLADVVSVLTLPSGTKISLSDLENLVLNKEIDSFELRRNDSELILNIAQLRPEESRAIELILLREFEIQNSVPVSATAYVDYAREESIVFTKA